MHRAKMPRRKGYKISYRILSERWLSVVRGWLLGNGYRLSVIRQWEGKFSVKAQLNKNKSNLIPVR